MQFTIKIPVTQNQHQLLNIMVGQSPFKVEKKDVIGRLILNNFRTNKTIQPVVYKKSSAPLNYEIIIPNKWVERHGIQFISDESFSDFIEYLKYEFQQRMFCYIDSVLDFKNTYNQRNKQLLRKKAMKKELLVAKMKEAALNFLYKNNLTEEFMNFDTIKKAYQRKVAQSADRMNTT